VPPDIEPFNESRLKRGTPYAYVYSIYEKHILKINVDVVKPQLFGFGVDLSDIVYFTPIS